MLVKTPHKFITAKLSIRKPGSLSVLIFIGLMNQKLCIYLRSVSTNKTIIICMFHRHANIQRTQDRIMI